jgi:hypothetical protein
VEYISFNILKFQNFAMFKNSEFCLATCHDDAIKQFPNVDSTNIININYKSPRNPIDISIVKQFFSLRFLKVKGRAHGVCSACIKFVKAVSEESSDSEEQMDHDGNEESSDLSGDSKFVVFRLVTNFKYD